METRVTPTFCRICEPSCGLLAETQGGKFVGLKPDNKHPITKGFACHKGLLFGDIHNDVDRLMSPLRKQRGTEKDDEFSEVSWDIALDRISESIKGIQNRYGKDAVGIYVGNPVAFNTLGSQSVGSFAAALETRSMFSSGTQDCANKFACSEAVYGTSTLHPIPDIEKSQYILVFGENPKVSHMSFMSIANPMVSFKKAKSDGATIRYVNPRRIESVSDKDNEWVHIKPDTDLYLLAALLNEMDRMGLFIDRVIAEHGRNIDGLRKFIQPYTAAVVSHVIGIPAEKIITLAREFGEAESASIHMSTGVNMGRQGTLCYWLLQMMSFVTGNLDKAGGNRYSPGFYPATKAGRVTQEEVFFSSEFGDLRYVRGMLPANLLSNMIESEESPIKALVVVAGNPLLSVAGESSLRQAFEKLDLLVCLDIYQNATAELADYLLPCCDMLERSDINICGLGMQNESYVQFTDAVVNPLGERREEWWILNEIMKRVNGSRALDRSQDIHARTRKMLSASAIKIEDLKRASSNTITLKRKKEGVFYRDWIQTKDKRVDCCPRIFTCALNKANDIFVELTMESPYQVKLINLRTNYMQNSWFQNVKKLKRGKHLDNPLHISPFDAARLRVEDGDSVYVETHYGRLQAQIFIDNTLRQGAVAMTHGWGNDKTKGMNVALNNPGVNVNKIMPTGIGSYEKISNQSFLTGVPVNIIKMVS
ncbi:hypothetical protein A9Q99_21360 [Gammaproteobacteria bacterium 45_16_T64]|mgnify:CR=1 FL=1|nr:hypothetical protein A9Q99_21360 [Gammaproteobacteria bacterium 45_16_T64]